MITDITAAEDAIRRHLGNLEVRLSELAQMRARIDDETQGIEAERAKWIDLVADETKAE